jgi:hypothetical protein
MLTARHQRAGRTVDRACRSGQRRTLQRPAELGAHPEGAPRAPGCPAHAPVRGTIAEHTPAEPHHQKQGPATRVLAGATRGGCGQAPAGPGLLAAVATSRAPRCVRAQW